MRRFSLDLKKYGLGYLETIEMCDLTDDDIKKMTNAFSDAMIAPNVPEIVFEPKNVQKLLNFSKCRKCGKCCLYDKTTPDDL